METDTLNAHGASVIPSRWDDPAHLLTPVPATIPDLYVAQSQVNRWAAKFPKRFRGPIRVTRLWFRGPNGEVACAKIPKPGHWQAEIGLHRAFFKLDWMHKVVILAHELAHFWNVNSHEPSNTLAHNAYHRAAEARILRLHNLRLCYMTPDRPFMINTMGNRVLRIY
jgi:hypothetical protein